ncbi:MAG: EamA family transporter [Crocinitomicaceae bacterium]|nr:EamA family transporter [Crocinitomicaceae bacterium]|tara:strand:- start:33950 stop:34834 length:885 start_codon:yes stop_codon:yes gene_type:complete
MRSKTLVAHLAVLSANLIYGINYTFAKDVMPGYIKPFGFIFLRAMGALSLFWTVSFLYGQEKIERQDFKRLALCGFFGVALNQLTFFSGLSITSPINAAIIMTTNPVLVLLAASIILHDRITFQKITGISLGIVGAAILILFKGDFTIDTSTWYGDLLVFINSMSYGIYLVIVSPLMRKYEPLTVIKWVFTFGFLFIIPFGFNQFNEIEWQSFTLDIWLKTGFVVIFTTFFAYLLGTIGLKSLRPATVSTYIYFQPVFAAFFAIMLGKDELDLIKIIATLLIFSGVFLVSRKFN